MSASLHHLVLPIGFIVSPGQRGWIDMACPCSKDLCHKDVGDVSFLQSQLLSLVLEAPTLIPSVWPIHLWVLFAVVEMALRAQDKAWFNLERAGLECLQ